VTDYVSLDEGMDLSGDNVGEGFRFNPLSKVIYSDYDEFFLRPTDEQWSNYIHFPLGERP